MAPKKKSTQTLSLGDFLSDQNLGSWADEMEDAPIASESRSGYGERRAFSSNTQSYADRGYATMQPRDPLPLPTKPPYTAHLGNLPFDATQADIEDFFSGCEVTSVRIVEDKLDRRPKGFGYVEFGTLDGLKAALDLSSTQFQGRNIRISVADPPKDRPDAREFNDWTRKGPLPDLPGQNVRRASERGGFGRQYEAPEMERGGSRRSNAPEGDGKTRDLGNWERRGPLSPVPGAEPARAGPPGGRVRPSGENFRERRDSPSWGEGRAQQEGEEGRPARAERPAPERAPTAAELDNKWRDRMRPDQAPKSKTPTPDASIPSSPSQPPALTVRPKLNLAKRTVSEAEPQSATTPGGSSIFGGARAVDTAAREKEIEEKRIAAAKAKKEAEDKEREEKKAKEAEAKAAAEKAAEEAKTAAANGDAAAAPAEGEEKAAGAEGAKKDVRVNGTDEKFRSRGPPREPREFRERGNRGPREPREPRDGDAPPRGPRNNGPPRTDSWRRKPSGQGPPAQDNSAPASPATPSAGPDEDGWSTVAPKSRPSKGGRTGGAPRTAAA